MIVNVITRPVMKLEHPEDLSFFYECRTFLYKKILSGYVRVLDLSSFLPPLLNNVGLKRCHLKQKKNEILDQFIDRLLFIIIFIENTFIIYIIK